MGGSVKIDGVRLALKRLVKKSCLVKRERGHIHSSPFFSTNTPKQRRPSAGPTSPDDHDPKDYHPSTPTESPELVKLPNAVRLACSLYWGDNLAPVTSVGRPSSPHSNVSTVKERSVATTGCLGAINAQRTAIG